MATDAEQLAERRSLRRRLSGWRIVALLAVLAAIVVGSFWAAGDDIPGTAHVARVHVSGLITGDRKTIELLKRVGESAAAKAVLVVVDSPGGTTTGSEAIYDALRRLSAQKPTVAAIDSIGASGAYIAAMGTDRIFARHTALVGSIGVLVQFPNFARLLDIVGVKMEEVKSSPLKAAPNGFEPTSPEARAALASVVSDSYDWFKGLVRQRRHYDDAQLAAVADGRVFTGHQALALKLIDQMGGERDAVAWLEANRGVAKDLPVREWRARSGSRFDVLTYASHIAAVLGFGDLANTLARSELAIDASRLDGMLALWHGPSEK
ncbi:signal peptide peptidase SppA [Chelatococcus reniformis]|uniref:Protease n=1 Tax=Chelatococcus reniformis TaxID=1494448 RepID=A0A916U9N2_9HYPH|nr:signal peptide peptidase SppA [Chelatococcus reniformis]GGC64209.1 protease [Chelatococcus reniformis]